MLGYFELAGATHSVCLCVRSSRCRAQCAPHHAPIVPIALLITTTMITVQQSAYRLLALAALCALTSCGGSSGSGSPPPPPPVTVDWDLAVETTNVVSPLSPSLVGHYDLSGVSFDYENVPGLIADMSQAGFSAPGGAGADWRIGLGRWENSTEILDTLTDGTACGNATAENRSSFATDLDLLASRDWFTYTDGAPVGSRGKFLFL